MKAIVSRNPHNRHLGIPEEIEAIDITNCVVAIQSLVSLANEVNKDPNAYGETAQAMAYTIKIIQLALQPQLDNM